MVQQSKSKKFPYPRFSAVTPVTKELLIFSLIDVAKAINLGYVHAVIQLSVKSCK